MDAVTSTNVRTAWNKGKLVGQKTPLRIRDVWAIRTRLQLFERIRDLALFDLGIDSKLRGCDLVSLRVRDIGHQTAVATRALVMQQKTGCPVQFEITAQTREAIVTWIRQAHLQNDDFLFPSRCHKSDHLGTRQYARIVHGWVDEIGLDGTAYGTPSDKGDADLPAHEEPSCGPNATGSHQARKHGALPRHRG